MKPTYTSSSNRPLSERSTGPFKILYAARAFLLVILVMPALAAGGETLLVSRADGPAGAGGDDHSLNPSISADGRFVAFDSGADNLSADDKNAFFNVFVHDTRGGPPGCSDVLQTVAHNQATSVALACADVDDDPITRSIVSSPAHGTLGAADCLSGGSATIRLAEARATTSSRAARARTVSTPGPATTRSTRATGFERPSIAVRARTA